jgi:ribosomal protein L7/L12
MAEARELLEINKHRELTGLGLKEAKEAIEKARSGS